MVFRNFDEMMNDSARIYTDSRARLEKRLNQLEDCKGSLNGDDYETRRFELVETLTMLERSRKLEDEMMNAATKDHLTGLFGSNYLRQRMPSWYAESKENLAVLMWDIDHFKEVNDRVDHDYGDTALKLIACEFEKRLKQAISPYKSIHAEIGRYGGEEFIAGLLNFNSNEKSLLDIADYIREGIANLRLSNDKTIPEDLKKRSITIVGKIYEAEDKSLFHFIKNYVDKQLILAKREDRRNSTIILPRRYIKESHKV